MLTKGLALFCLLVCLTECQVVRIPECDGLVFPVEENTEGTLTCDQYTNTVLWTAQAPGAGISNVGTCSAACSLDSASQGVFELTVLSSSSSRLTIDSSVTLRSQGGTTYRCGAAQCSLDIVVNAVLGDMSVSVTPAASGWTVTGTALITKVYSSATRYACVWARQHDNGEYTDIDRKDLFNESNPNDEDKSGSCGYIGALPAVTGTYTYRVTVIPGAVVKITQISVAAPPAPSITCSNNSLYVSEGTDLTCTCSGAVGQPSGRLVWVRLDVNDVATSTLETGSVGGTSLQLTMAVNRSHDGVKLRCDVDWQTDVTGPSHTVHVAYGPDSASIAGNPVFYTDGTRDLDLTCDPSAVNPTSGLTYTWTGRCSGSSNNSCTFKPRPPGVNDNGDDGASIGCSVMNPVNNNREASGAYTLTLKYPPREAPKISGYVNNQILYQGDPLTLTCTALGGDPLVTYVTLNCTSRPRGPTPGQTSSLVVTSLTDNDTSAVCTCRAAWVREDLYTQTDSRTLTVYTSPSLPVITRADGGTRPYLEKNNVTLNCAVTASGHPAANLTWSGHDNGAAVTASKLHLVSVGKGDNMRLITCLAENAFTQHKNVHLESNTTLNVYYGPYVTLRDGAGNMCVMTTDPSTCVAAEGQRLDMTFTADSNPGVESSQWTRSNSLLPAPGGEPGVNAALVIASLDRNDTGVYNLSVTSSKPDVTDGRLPLSAKRNLTVLVKYTATSPVFTIGSGNTLTVNESEAVTLVCHSQGRPTPTLQLMQGDVVLDTIIGGTLGLAERTELNHSLNAKCSNTGVLTCSADNVRNDVMLYVNCKPRTTQDATQPPVVNVVSGAAYVAFSLHAYPVPTSFNFSYLGNNTETSNGYAVVESDIYLNVTCFNTSPVVYLVTCNVTVDRVKGDTVAGYYSLRAANDVGFDEFLFEVTVNETNVGGTGQTTENGLNIAAVAGGVGAALVVIAVIALVLWLVRRRKQRAGKSNQQRVPGAVEGGRKSSDDEVMFVNDIYESADGKSGDDEVMIVNAIYSSADVEVKERPSTSVARSEYEIVDLPSSSSKPVILPKPKTTTQPKPGASNDTDMYAVVNKKDKMPVASGDNVQAEINKTKGELAPTSDNDVYAEVKKGKQLPASKTKKTKKGKGKGKQSKEAEPLYGNYGALLMSPPDSSVYELSPPDSVYENHGFQKDDPAPPVAQRPGHQSAKGGTETGEEDAETLNYTTIAFSAEQLAKGREPPPIRENTDYVDIDHTRKAPPPADYDYD